ncbi:hypothetical protein [Exiguobacterium sp. s57]|uniref:hypothetical protein n=1 Tax=Exiguobacterium sp. s57 TaxID=2751258 RepID=UPI001BEB3332|nr:hypothetical protein [Exiguobacterium sp. s57]
MFEFIDPFLWQLVIVPILTIGIGVLTAWRTKRFWIGPVVTLLLNGIIEKTMAMVYYNESFLSIESFSSFTIINAFFSLFVSFVLVGPRKTSKSA